MWLDHWWLIPCATEIEIVQIFGVIAGIWVITVYNPMRLTTHSRISLATYHFCELTHQWSYEFNKPQWPYHVLSDQGFFSKTIYIWTSMTILRYHRPFFFFTRLRSRRVVMCLVVVYGRSFVPTLIQLRVFNIFWPNLKYRKKKVPRRF